jgi:hypothetical protein
VDDHAHPGADGQPELGGGSAPQLVTGQRGRNEAVFSVIGVFDGYVGTAFDCELRYHGLAATTGEVNKWRDLGENF